MSDVATLLAQLAARTEPAADPAMAAVRLARATIDALILKLGQTIDAKVTAQLAGGLTQLTAGPEIFVLKLATPLPVDTAVTLKITPTPSGQPSITVTPQQPAIAAPLAPPAPAPVMAQSAVTALPTATPPQPATIPAASPALASTPAPTSSPPPTAAAPPPIPPSTSPSPLRGGDRGGGQPAPAQPAIVVPTPPAPTPQPPTTATLAATRATPFPAAATAPAAISQPIPASPQSLTTAPTPIAPPAAGETPQIPAPSPVPPAAQAAPSTTPPLQAATATSPLSAPAYPLSPAPATQQAAPVPSAPLAQPSGASSLQLPTQPAAASSSLPVAQPSAPPAPPTPAAPSLAQVLANPVQAALHQDSAAPLIAKLASLIASPASVGLPRPLLEAIIRVLANRIELDRRPPDGRALRDAVLRAGVLTEPASRQPADAKSALLQLRATLADTTGGPAPVAPVTRRPPPPLKGDPARAPQPQSASPLAEEPAETVRQLLGHTDAALSRLKLLQLASGAADPRPSAAPATAPEFRVEIPLQLGAETGILQLLVQRDGKHKASPRERGWRMRFALNFAATGEVGAEIALLGRSANVALWAAEPATADALEAMLPELTAALARHGLDTGNLRVRRGAPPRPAPVPGRLLDSAR